jgi:hypothetical protein
MHNTLMVMDNALAIVGGRNMSDPYFEVDPRANFRDLDAEDGVLRAAYREFTRAGGPPSRTGSLLERAQTALQCV